MNITITSLLGLMICVIASILIINPSLLGGANLDNLDAYQSIEQRVKWGLFLGLGLLFMFNTQWSSWLTIVMAVLFYITAGVIVARACGFVLDGIVGNQWLWMIIELVLLFAFGFFYWKLKSSK